MQFKMNEGRKKLALTLRVTGGVFLSIAKKKNYIFPS
jgi:hypothetical protein